MRPGIRAAALDIIYHAKLIRMDEIERSRGPTPIQALADDLRDELGDAPGLQWLQSARILLQASSSCRVQNAQVIVFSA